jgi:hypothetical protein
MNTNGVIDIRQSATITQLQEENMYLKGQNEAVFKMLSYLTEQSGGNLTIPHNFAELVIGSSFAFDRNDNGDYVMETARDENTEAVATTE